jgi:hypothetical protein
MIVAAVARHVDLSLRGFYLKRRLFLGSAGGVVAWTAKPPSIRTGPSVYDLETTLFNRLGFAKPDEKQIDQRFLTFVALVVWALVTVYAVLQEFSGSASIVWFAGFLVAGSLLTFGDKIAARRTSK